VNGPLQCLMKSQKTFFFVVLLIFSKLPVLVDVGVSVVDIAAIIAENTLQNN